MRNVESAAMVAKNVSNEEDIMSIYPIPEYMVYYGFNQDISASLVYKSILDSHHDYPIWDHDLALLRFCMVGIWRNTGTKPFVPHRNFYKMIPSHARMWAQPRSKQVLTTLAPASNTGIRPAVPHPPHRRYLQQHQRSQQT